MKPKSVKKGEKPPPKTKMVGLRVPLQVAGDVEGLAQAWKLSPGQVYRKLVLMGHEAAVKEPTINPRIVLLANKLAHLSAENRLKAEVLLSLLEKEVTEMLASQEK